MEALHSTSLSCQCEKFSWSHIKSEMDRTKRKCYGVPASISRFNHSRLLPSGNFKEPQTLEELRDQIEHATNDIPLATIQTICRSVRRRCWECTVAEGGHFQHARSYGKLRNRTQHKLYLRHISLLGNNVSKSVHINFRHSVIYYQFENLSFSYNYE